MHKETFDAYLGDGVYASFDGYHVILDLRGQDTTTRIALEPPVLHALNEYVKRLSNRYESPHLLEALPTPQEAP
mgnify:CR=1 FL=1